MFLTKSEAIKYVILPLLFLLSLNGFSQNETNHWYFGKNAGLDFNSGEVDVLTDGNMVTPAGCSSISDFNGNLMFYSNGQNIWNRNHQIMNNGNDLVGDIEGVQTSIIIPKPNDSSTYYVFYTRENAVTIPTVMSAGVYYSEIKFNAQNPLGIVVLKNQRIANTATSRLAAIYDNDSDTYKVLFVTKPNAPILNQNGEELFVFRIFNVSPSGINLTPILITINESISTSGPLKISPDGKYIALVDALNMNIHTYKYNLSLDSIIFYKRLNSIPAFGLLLTPYGLEFSQDSKMLYYTGSDGQGNAYIVQVQFSRLEDMDPPDYYYFIERQAKSLQLARNGKIYVSKGDLNSPSNQISVINKPEKAGSDCLFQSGVISLVPGSSTKGLPNFIVSSLRNRIIVSEDRCINTSFDFSLDMYAQIISVQWDFGDGNFSNDLNPSHAFTTPGFQKIKATVVTQNRTFVLYKKVIVFPPPLLPPNQVLTQCDTDNDGFSIFNLENISDFISNANFDFEYCFYNDSQDAQNDTNRIQNPNQYINRSNLEEIFVKIITEKGCPLITSFFIENRTTTSTTQIPNFYICENSDGIMNNLEGQFDLSVIESDIIALLSIPPGYEVNFYSSFLDAQTKLNQKTGLYIVPSGVLWIRVEDENNTCNGIFSFNIVVNSPIEINIENVYTICDSTIQSPVVLDGGINNTSWTWKDRNDVVLSNQRLFYLTEEGRFSVVLEKLENGIICTETKRFIVRNAEVPVLKEISSDNNEIFISIEGTGNYEFSIDNISYFGSGNSHTFQNLEPGIYTVYVKDVTGCNYVIKDNVLLIKSPSYFTPNNDGINDYWRIYGPLNDFYSSVEVNLFDRFGNLLHSMNLIESNLGWDGTSKNKMLPSSDYWYKVTFKDFNDNTITKRGHFSLIR